MASAVSLTVTTLFHPDRPTNNSVRPEVSAVSGHRALAASGSQEALHPPPLHANRFSHSKKKVLLSQFAGTLFTYPDLTVTEATSTRRPPARRARRSMIPDAATRAESAFAANQRRLRRTQTAVTVNPARDAPIGSQLRSTIRTVHT